MIATLRECTLAELEATPGFAELVAEYADESRMHGMPEPKPHLDTYRKLEQAGVMHIITALVDDRLVGLAILLISIVPHYSVPMAHTESLFVGEAYRPYGLGLHLLNAAEEKAKLYGAHGLFVSAPVGSVLAKVLESTASYNETNRVFMKVLA